MVVNVPDNDILVSEFEHQPDYCTHFRTNALENGTNFFYTDLSYSLKFTTTVLLQEWL